MFFSFWCANNFQYFQARLENVWKIHRFTGYVDFFIKSDQNCLPILAKNIVFGENTAKRCRIVNPEMSLVFAKIVNEIFNESANVDFGAVQKIL